MNKKKIMYNIVFIIIKLTLIIILLKVDNNLYSYTIFTKFDATHYIDIAINGYHKKYLYVFYPLFPLLLRIHKLINTNIALTGIILNFILSIIFYNILYDELQDKFNIILYIFTPINIFLLSLYTEPLSMLLSILAYKYYKSNSLYKSAFCIGLSTITRSVNIYLVLALMISKENFKITKQNIKSTISLGLTATAPYIVYITYLYNKTGDFMYFNTVSKKIWLTYFSYPFRAIIEDIHTILTYNNTRIKFIHLLYLVIISIISYIILISTTYKAIKNSDRFNSIFLLLNTITLATFYCERNIWHTTSIFRYVFGLYPIYLYNKNKILLAISIIVNTINIFLFSYNYFIG